MYIAICLQKVGRKDEVQFFFGAIESSHYSLSNLFYQCCKFHK